MSDLDSFNILVGKNNTGKSTILDAIQTFCQALNHGHSQNQDDHVWPKGKPSKASMEFSALFEVTRNELAKSNIPHYKLISFPNKDKPIQVTISYSFQKGITENPVAQFAAKIHSSAFGISRKDVEESLVEYARKTLGKIKRIDVVRGKMSDPPPNRHGIRGTLIPESTINTMRQWRRSRKREYINKFDEVVRIFRELTNESWSLRFDVEHLCLVDGEYEAEINSLGGGIQEMIHLAFELVDSPYLLLIEEPESHAHPEQTKRVYDVLRTLTENHVMFITTHSTVFADHASFSEVYQVYKTDGTTECRKIIDSNFTSVAAT